MLITLGRSALESCSAPLPRIHVSCAMIPQRPYQSVKDSSQLAIQQCMNFSDSNFEFISVCREAFKGFIARCLMTAILHFISKRWCTQNPPARNCPTSETAVTQISTYGHHLWVYFPHPPKLFLARKMLFPLRLSRLRAKRRFPNDTTTGVRIKGLIWPSCFS